MRRISCEDLALGFACKKIVEAETDEEVIDRALAHARDEHHADDLDRERLRALVTADE